MTVRRDLAAVEKSGLVKNVNGVSVSYTHLTDDGYSGANFQRPGFQAMLADSEACLLYTSYKVTTSSYSAIKVPK